MATWYLGKIRYQREDEAGSLKTINEAYLVDAVSYTEAEARMFEVVASAVTYYLSSVISTPSPTGDLQSSTGID